MDIVGEQLISLSKLYGSYASSMPDWERNADLDRTFYCLYFNQGVLASRGSISGSKGSAWTPTPVVVPDYPPGLISSWTKPALPLPDTELISQGSILGSFHSDLDRRNWVMWSKIGELNFTLDSTNDAGWMPMPWQGWVFGCKALNGKVIAYGQNGIEILTPAGGGDKYLAPTFGKSNLYSKGLLSTYTFCGDDKVHYFIDQAGQLGTIGVEGLKILGYEEFLYPMKFSGTPIVMFYESGKQEVYICNGVVGYIFNSKGLGGGPTNLTSLGYLGIRPVWASAKAFDTPLPYVVTEVIDLGSRDVKTCYGFFLGCGEPTKIEACVEYRTNIDLPYLSTSWRSLNNQGKVFFNVSGIEFKMHFRAKESTQLSLNNFKIYFRLFDRTMEQINMNKGSRQ